MLALFTGARRGELTGLRPADVAYDKVIGATSIYITADRKTGKRLKTRQSARVVPLHPDLVKLGFLDFTAAQAKERVQGAWLFPHVAPGTTGEKAWSKLLLFAEIWAAGLPAELLPLHAMFSSRAGCSFRR